jgi:hypothetical protein
MKKSKRSLVPRLRKGGLAVVLVVCLLALVVYLGGSLGRQRQLSTPDFESMDSIEQQAWQLADEVVGASREVQEQFVAELLDLCYKAKDSDLAIFCNAGGWGKKPLAADYQGRTWMAGIEAKLTELGCDYCIVDGVRTGSGMVEYLVEFKEQLTHYPSKAKELAAKIRFLTQQVSGLKIIVAGQSSGAAFSSEVARYLEDYPGVYSIQVGTPFWHRAPEVAQSLVIDNSGVGADALAGRDLVTLFKANWVKLFVIGQAPSFTPVDWLMTRAFLVFGAYNFNLGMEAPGHEYMWEYPGVGPVIEAFLAENFGTE